MDTMRALVVRAPGELALEEVAKPAPEPFEALVRVECCGICNSTDWKVIRGQMEWAGPFPLVLGHESVGVIEAVGDGVESFRVGDRVTRPIVPRRDGGINSAFGGFADYGIVTDAQAMAKAGHPEALDDYNAQRQRVVPAGVHPVQAALGISLAETASVLARLPNLRNKRVLVVGTGIAGLALALWCKLAGAWVATVGRRNQRLAAARRLAADAIIDTSRESVGEALQRMAPLDIVIDAVGDPDLAASVADAAPPHAQRIAYGAPPAGQRYDGRWTIAEVREQDTYDWVVDLMQRQIVPVDELISHTWTFDQCRDAFAAVDKGHVLKGFVRIAPAVH